MEGDLVSPCAQALTVRSNLPVDVLACSYNVTDQPAVSIAHQITGKGSREIERAGLPTASA